MKNTDISEVYFNNNDVIALYRGDTLIYQKATGPVYGTDVLAGTFFDYEYQDVETPPEDDYAFKYNNSEFIHIPVKADLSFEVEVPALTTCCEMFNNLKKLRTITHFPPTENVTSMQFMFLDCKNLTSINTSNFITDNVTDMGWMFSGCESLSNIDLSTFNTQNVTSMHAMFGSCAFENMSFPAGFNTEKVTDMYAMFTVCGSLKHIDLSQFNTKNVNTLFAMFSECMNLESINFGDTFTAEKVTTMQKMFYFCKSLKTLDFSKFNTKNLTNLTSTFQRCDSLTTINFGNNFDMSKVTNFSNAFANTGKLTTIIGKLTGIKRGIELWMSPLTNESAMVFIDGLANVTSTQRIAFKDVTFNTLTEEQLAVATSKGWSVVVIG